MESKTYTWVGAAVGSMVGGTIPNLWGAGIFSFSGIIFSSLGAILGIWLAFKLTHY